MALLQVDGLVKTYPVRRGLFRRDRFTAVSDVSFHVEPGETVALVGESGCGKSTVGKCILRLIDADDGTISFRGEQIQHLPNDDFRPYRKHIQMVFQDPLNSFNPIMPVGQAIVEPLRLRDDLSNGERREVVLHLLEQVGLNPDFAGLRPQQMSGGQLQRVGIARAIAPRPELIFLDEPTSALDMSIRGQIVNLLLALQAEHNLSYVLVTHDLRLVRDMADRVVVMYLGEIVEEGSAGDILDRPLHPYTQGLLAATMLGRDRQQRREQRARLRGEAADSSMREFAGCKLYRRCPFAQDRCAEEPQTLREVMPGRRARCWRTREIQAELANVRETDG